MTQPEKNIKLAEWAGIKRQIPDCESPEGKIIYWQIPLPEGGILITQRLPNFYKSMDACEKYLIPKLNKLGIYVHCDQMIDSYLFTCSLYDDKHSKSWDILDKESWGVALCEAVGKAFQLWE